MYIGTIWDNIINSRKTFKRLVRGAPLREVRKYAFRDKMKKKPAILERVT